MFVQTFHLAIVVLVVFAVEPRSAGGHRRVHRHGQDRNSSFLFKLSKVVDQQLSPADGERRYDHFAATLNGFIDDQRELFLRIRVLVKPVAVRRFDQQEVGFGNGRRIVQDRLVVTAEVA